MNIKYILAIFSHGQVYKLWKTVVIRSMAVTRAYDFVSFYNNYYVALCHVINQFVLSLDVYKCGAPISLVIMLSEIVIMMGRTCSFF